MPHIQLIRLFSFEAAHLLPYHEGDCRHVHGHSYRLEVQINGPVQAEHSGPESGMVMDLKQLKELVQTAIVAPCDHALLLPDFLPEPQLEAARSLSTKILLLPFSPTAENLVGWMARQLQAQLPAGVELAGLVLWETAQAGVRWLPGGDDLNVFGV